MELFEDGTMTPKSALPARADRARRVSYADQTYEHLRQEIVECRLPPGRRLTEASVAELVQVGKMPVREALQRLVLEGLVQVIPRHGYRVAPITLREVRELFALRLVVEPAATERAAGRIDAVESAALRKLSDIGYTLTGREAVRRYLRANTEFHTRIAQCAGSRRLADLVAGLLRESERLITFVLPTHPRSAPTVAEHRRLLGALVRGEGKAARRLAEAHIRSTETMVTEAILAHAEVEDAPIEA